MSVEHTRAQRWIWQRLTDNAALIRAVGADNVYEYPAPQGTTAQRYVLIDFRAGTDLMAKGARAGVVLYYGVTAVAAGLPTLRLEEVADAIDEALAGQSGQVQDVVIRTCERAQTLHGTSLETGDGRRYLGGLYKLTCQAVAP